MPYTVVSYIHSDSLSLGKGGCLAKIETQTDFCANTEEVQLFVMKIARMGYGHTSTFDEEHEDLGEGILRIGWQEMADKYEYLQKELNELKKEMKEEIKVTAIVCLCGV